MASSQTTTVIEASELMSVPGADAIPAVLFYGALALAILAGVGCAAAALIERGPERRTFLFEAATILTAGFTGAALSIWLVSHLTSKDPLTPAGPAWAMIGVAAVLAIICANAWFLSPTQQHGSDNR
ncbi:hypothetical protein DFR67_116129 [Williamsia limnetica]|uniref:Uncharacterized protein n=1 Tax=Williamsia limnetica TaxID=882452 RepID=A0A318RPM0_WILLI|nr:hypothetical protein [Williamsia limnetica]PYE13575.1 hypothetical protein DFR67_116129 [Williamsia limnetica]